MRHGNCSSQCFVYAHLPDAMEELDVMRSQHRQQRSRASDNSPPAGHSIISVDDWTVVAQILDLSEREFAIVKLVFDDRSDEGIADELGISRHTVNTHLSRLYRKLNVHSRVQLVVRTCSEFLSHR